MRTDGGHGHRRRGVWLVTYLAALVGGAAALWYFIPREVWQTIYETYIAPGRDQP